MVEMVEARKNVSRDKVEQRYDLFSGLLDAAQDGLGKGAALGDDELIGEYSTQDSTSQSFGILGKCLNMFSQETCLSFFLPDMRCDLPLLTTELPQNGSLQTTAHTLCFAFALLALNPEEQERLYQHIKGVMSSLNVLPASSMYLDSYIIES